MPNDGEEDARYDATHHQHVPCTVGAAIPSRHVFSAPGDIATASKEGRLRRDKKTQATRVEGGGHREKSHRCKTCLRTQEDEHEANSRNDLECEVPRGAPLTHDRLRPSLPSAQGPPNEPRPAASHRTPNDGSASAPFGVRPTPSSNGSESVPIIGSHVLRRNAVRPSSKPNNNGPHDRDKKNHPAKIPNDDGWRSLRDSDAAPESKPSVIAEHIGEPNTGNGNKAKKQHPKCPFDSSGLKGYDKVSNRQDQRREPRRRLTSLFVCQHWLPNTVTSRLS